MNAGYTNIPNDIVRSESLDVYEKALLNVLLSYSGCEKIYPSYAVLTKQTGIKRSKLAESVKSLQKKGLISVIREEGFSTNLYTINKNTLVHVADGIVHNTDGAVHNADGIVRITDGSSPAGGRGIVHVADANNISINNINYKEEILLSGRTTGSSQTNANVLPSENLKKKKPEDKVDYQSDYQSILDCLNNATGKNFRLTSNFKHKVNGRLSEKYTVDDFKKVISNMASEWKGTDMEKHLNPDTLFGGKFDKYLNFAITINPAITRKRLN